MWRGSLRRNLKQVLSETHHYCRRPNAQELGQTRPLHHQTHVNTRYPEVGCYQDSIFIRNKGFRCCNYELLGNGRFLSSTSSRRSYGAAAAEASVSTSEEEVDEIQELVEKTTPAAKKWSPPSGTYYKLRDRQWKIECDAWKDAAIEYQELVSDMCEKKLAPNLPYIKTLFLGWFEPLRDAIDAEQKLCKAGNRAPYAPYIVQLPAEMIAVIAMHTLMGLLMTSGGNGYCTTVQAVCQLGDAIEHEARIHEFLANSKNKIPFNRTAEEGLNDEAKDREKLRKKVKSLMKTKQVYAVRKIVAQQEDFKHWGRDAQVKVGSRVIELLLETAYIQPPVDQMEDAPPDIRPAFVHSLRTIDSEVGTRRYGVIECDPLIRKGLEKTARHMVIPYMPMLIPPLNWTGFTRGAYLFLPSYVMRTHGSKQQRAALKRAPKSQLEPLFQALNTLGNTKWKVNTRMLSVIDRIWANGGRLGGLVDRDDVPFPVKPDTEDESEIKKWKWKIREVKKDNSERHAQRCDVELKLAVARKMKDEEGFFYPHNIDFRGRAYPMHPYLHHLGSDFCRGILEFAEGRPLGKSGLRWLKVQIASLFGGGADKLSFEARIAFTENNLKNIFDSADRPLEGNGWWLGAEEPFQCLASCMDLTEALRSPYPEATLSHTPVHQDGSCNGLQHYAALGRDKSLAAAVNLVRGDKPADVYSGIATRVHEIMKRDAVKDPAVSSDAFHARLLIGQVDRKLVKQTVMTSVYGVTFMGARDQIKKRIKEKGIIVEEADQFKAAHYAAQTTFTALEEMFTAARGIMYWLGECAQVIAEQNQLVRWTTPVGLPVVQPYCKKGKHYIKTSLQVLTLQCDTDKVLARKHKTSFPPNFVHSLDGSHMMKTAIACSELGLNFAGVHDSYWTHACDVETMNKILREKFVELYEEPVLENLLEHFQTSFPKLKFPPLPERGDFDLKEVLEATYFFN